jgi:chromosome segregation protein
VYKEYERLLEKKEILGKEKEDVLKLIEEIESSKKAIFMKTFAVVNDIFKDFFSRLTGKGQAYLELENQESPFEAGVEIKVKLSAKKFMDIKSLSGGEKTLTALAFIFAIQEHDPASFYIMDEVDAALDKHNSEKLAQLIRSYCDRAQYIVISHNDAVISEASNLYGISMNEDGISNVTSLEL